MGLTNNSNRKIILLKFKTKKLRTTNNIKK